MLSFRLVDENLSVFLSSYNSSLRRKLLNFRRKQFSFFVVVGENDTGQETDDNYRGWGGARDTTA